MKESGPTLVSALNQTLKFSCEVLRPSLAFAIHCALRCQLDLLKMRASGVECGDANIGLAWSEIRSETS